MLSLINAAGALRDPFGKKKNTVFPSHTRRRKRLSDGLKL